MHNKSWIAKINSDKTVTGIYCHTNGQVNNGVGSLLVDYWYDKKSVDDLLSGGDLLSLGQEMGVLHSADDDANNMNLYYIRDMDKNLDDYESSEWDNEYEFKFACKSNNSIGFVYLFKNGSWSVLDTLHSNRFIPISDFIHNDDAIAI